jgi:hypothetical protein
MRQSLIRIQLFESNFVLDRVAVLFQREWLSYFCIPLGMAKILRGGIAY